MKREFSIDPKRGLPVRSGLFYKCIRCGDALASDTETFITCKCLNISIDPCGRMGFQHPELVKLFEEVPMMPPNRGFAGTPVDTIISVGSVVDRYGSDDFSEFLYAGNPQFLFRSLPTGLQRQPHWFYEVKREFIAKLGRACSWYGQVGAGMLIDLGIGNTVQDLIDQGILVEITPPQK